MSTTETHSDSNESTDEPTWTDLNAFQHECLTAIAVVEDDPERKQSGSKIQDELSHRYQQEVTCGRLYPNLDELADAGLIEKGQFDRRTNSYTLSEAGESLLEEEARNLAQVAGLPIPMTDGGVDIELSQREFNDRFRESYYEHEEVRCATCNDKAIGLSDAESLEEAAEVWNTHVREEHEPVTDGGQVVAEDPQPDNSLVVSDLTAFQTRTLFVTAQLTESDDDCYGLAIKRGLEAFYGEEILHGRLYPNLDELVERGLLVKSMLDRRTNAYEISDAGREALREYHDWEAERLGLSRGA